MRCPHCGGANDKVLESRTLAQGSSVRRRRECLECGARFTSYERIEEKPLMVVKKDLRREPFDRKKLEQGIARAMEKRPFSSSVIENLVNEIEEDLIKRACDGEVPSEIIGLAALEKLYGLDKVAYIRFASVYRRFSNVEEFIAAVNGVTESALCE